MKANSSTVVIKPETDEMERLFGLKTGLFWTVKLLKENNPLLKKNLTINSRDFEKFKKPFIVHGFKFAIQEYHNLYYISLRMRTDRNLNGKVRTKKIDGVINVVQGLRTKADKKMRNAVISRQGDSWVKFKKSKGYAGNHNGARYRLYNYWMELLTPWLAKRHGLKENQTRLVFILLLINSGFEEVGLFFKEWKRPSEHSKKVFRPSVSPLDPEFVSVLDRRLRQQVKKITKAVNPRMKELEDFLRVINRASSLPIVINGIPTQVVRILGGTAIKSKNFTKEDIEYVLYRLRGQNHKKYFMNLRVWPKKFELPKSHPRVKLFKERYEKELKEKKAKKPQPNTKAEENLKTGKFYIGKED